MLRDSGPFFLSLFLSFSDPESLHRLTFFLVRFFTHLFLIVCRFANTSGGLGKCIPHDLLLEFWNRTAKDLLIDVGFRNLTPKKIMDIGGSISTVHKIKANWMESLGVASSSGWRHRHEVNVKDEKIIMTKLKAAGFRGNEPSFGDGDKGQFNNLDPNPIGAVDVVRMQASLKRRLKVLVATSKQVFPRVHPRPQQARPGPAAAAPAPAAAPVAAAAAAPAPAPAPAPARTFLGFRVA